MTLTLQDDIHALRDKINAQLEQTNELILASGDNVDLIKALRAMARELSDFENLLADAAFLKNTSAIAKLTGEISEATEAGVIALRFIQDIHDAAITLRKATKGVSTFVGKVKTLAKDVDDLSKFLQASHA